MAAMTNWWLLLTFLVFVYTYGVNSSKENIWMNYLRGSCAVTALCVVIGYYVFMLCFNLTQTPTLTEQFYEKSWKLQGFSYSAFIVIDIMIHIFGCFSIYLLWKDSITVGSTCLAFIFHRLWSFVNSGGKTLYYQADIVYNFKKRVPVSCWIAVYGVENLICLAFLLISIYRMKYY